MFALREILELFKFESMCDKSFLQLMNNSNAFDFLPRLPLGRRSSHLILEACANKCKWRFIDFDILFIFIKYFLYDRSKYQRKKADNLLRNARSAYKYCKCTACVECLVLAVEFA